jgi:hypothetical protein
MLSLPYLESKIRDTFSNETKNQPQTFVSRLKQWCKQVFTSNTHRRFAFTHKKTISFNSAMQSLGEIFPGYEIYMGCRYSYELYQETMQNAHAAGNKMFWFTISNDQVELELTFLVTRDHWVEASLSQRPLTPITYARTTPSSAA